MPISLLRSILIIVLVAATTFFTRAVPFVIFPKDREVHPVIAYLGKALPPAVIGMLVIYCFKSVSIGKFPFGLPELIAGVAVVALHIWKRNNLLSIGIGTILYMILVQAIFK
ncbi:AzlD domain-containing protein [Lachnospiraceae bacterium ZAX-1]